MPSTTPIPAPPLVPPRHGLTISLNQERTDARWMNPDAVVTYSPEGCNQAGVAQDMCESTEFDYESRPDIVSWKPYFLSVTERCSTFSGLEENVARIRRLMEADTERQLGEEFWDGALAQSGTLPDGNPYPNSWLASTDSDDLTGLGGAVALTHALACLDDYLCDNNSGSPGTIHATCQTIDHWAGPLHLLRPEITERGIRYYSPLGNLVIPSPGYNGGSPEGRQPATNDIWAYATDMPRLFLGPIQVAAVENSIDRSTNTVEMVAQRPALVEWQLCRHAAIQMAMTICGQGGS